MKPHFNFKFTEKKKNVAYIEIALTIKLFADHIQIEGLSTVNNNPLNAHMGLQMLN